MKYLPDSIARRKRVHLAAIIVTLIFVVAGMVSVVIGLTKKQGSNNTTGNNITASQDAAAVAAAGADGGGPSQAPGQSPPDNGGPAIPPTDKGAELETVIVACPEPGPDPLTLDLPHDGANLVGVLLENAPPGVLCTLLEVDSQPTSTDIALRPIGRSYDGNGWESYRSSYFTNVVPPECSQDNVLECQVILPTPSAGRKYVLKSYQYQIEAHDQAARLLEKTTFGPTKAEISAFTTPQEWVRDQLELPATSHRQFFRQRSTNWHAETTYHGLLRTGPCDEGARYRKFVFLAKDVKRFLTVATSPLDANKRILSVGGHVRSVIDGRVKIGTRESIAIVAPDGRYVDGQHVSMRRQ